MADYAQTSETRSLSIGTTIGAGVGCVFAVHSGGALIAIVAWTLVGMALGALMGWLVSQLPLFGELTIWSLVIWAAVAMIFVGAASLLRQAPH
jgi:hypothetical protein